MVLTGIGEAIQNKKFLRLISELNNKLDDPFDIEIQTTGVLLNDENINFLKNIIGVKVISLSIFDIFDNLNNLSIIGVKEKLKFDIVNVCKKIKNIGLILRISLNLINVYDKHSVIDIFNKIDEIQPNQLTFRSLWFTDDDNPINKWIKSNNCSYGFLDKIKSFLSLNGRKVRESVYIYNGISIYLNDDWFIDILDSKTQGGMGIPPEIDVFEHFRKDSCLTRHHVTTTFHGGPTYENDWCKAKSRYSICPIDNKDMTAKLVWTPDRFTVTINGRETLNIEKNNSRGFPYKSMNVIVNSGMGDWEPEVNKFSPFIVKSLTYVPL